MRTTRSDSMLSDEALGQLQGSMLEAILTGSPLLGHSRPLDLPDLPAALSQPAIVLSSENLGGPIRVEGATKPIYILSEEAIQERARREGDLLYLRFQPLQSVPDGVRLTLELRIAQSQQHLPALGMGGVQVTFHQSGESWQAANDTAAFAA